jgi:Protein of unknown function (DUF2997)
MDLQELEFRIDPEGNVSIRVRGGKGAGCLEMTRAFEEELGIVKDRVCEGDFYQDPVEDPVRTELRNYSG